MSRSMNRRTMIRFTAAASGMAAAGVAFPISAAAGRPGSAVAAVDGDNQSATRMVGKVYQRHANRAGGTWNSLITIAMPGGGVETAVQVDPDTEVEAYSVNKIAVAVAVLDKVDRALLSIDQRIEVTPDILVPGGDGIFGLDAAYPSHITLGHVLAALLTISDDSASRMCGLVCPAAEINQIMVSKGFTKIQVKPVANPNRFFLGKTTPRETHDLLQALTRGALLSVSSTERLLSLLRAPIAFTDGIRRTMSSSQRQRIATKAGWFNDGRNEAGVMFDRNGGPALIYSMFAHGQTDPEDFGATHPAVQARARMGPAFLASVDSLNMSASTIPTWPCPAYAPSNGGGDS